MISNCHKCGSDREKIVCYYCKTCNEYHPVDSEHKEFVNFFEKKKKKSNNMKKAKNLMNVFQNLMNLDDEE